MLSDCHPIRSIKNSQTQRAHNAHEYADTLPHILVACFACYEKESITFYRRTELFVSLVYYVKTSLNCAIFSTEKRWDEQFNYSKYLLNHLVVSGVY